MPKLLILMILALGISLSGCGGGGSSPAAGNPRASNQAPTVNAGADQSVDEGTTVNLSGLGMDDSTIVSYGWQQESGTAVTITNADMANASFVAPTVAASEDLLFRVTVTDDDGATGSDTVTVTVNDVTPPPPPPVGDFIPLGDLPGGDFNSGASDVSDDGSVVVGGSSSASGGEAFRWTSTGGMLGLGDLPGGSFSSSASGVSADGSVVVGTGQIDGPSVESFRWTDAGGMVGLGDIPGGGALIDSTANGVSADGNVVVGRGNAPGALPGQGIAHIEAYRWTSGTGFVELGDLPGGNLLSIADAVSADGSVIVGTSNSASGFEAFRWTSGTSMVGLSDLADGSVVVGNGNNTSGPEATLWTSAGGMVGLGYLPGRDAESRAYGVSADGIVVVGQSQADNCSCSSEAFVWTQSGGMQSLRDVLIAKGVAGLDNWELREATNISADGQWVVGSGVNPSGFNEAFLANISAP